MIELVLPQGWALRKHLGLKATCIPDLNNVPSGGIDIRYLMDKDDRESYLNSGNNLPHLVAPMVVGTDTLAKDTLNELLKREDNELYCLDGTSGTLARATFRQKSENDDKLPLISIGNNKAIQAVRMPKHTEAMLDFYEAMASLGQNYTNAVLAEILGCSAPQPDKGLIPELFEATLDCLEYDKGSIRVKSESKIKFASLWSKTDDCKFPCVFLGQTMKDMLKLGIEGDFKIEEVELIGPEQKTKRSKVVRHTTIPIPTSVNYLDSCVSELLQNKDPNNPMSIHLLPTVHLNATINGNRKSKGFSAHQDADRIRGCDIVSKPTRIDKMGGDGSLGVFPTAEQLQVFTVVLSPPNHRSVLEVVWTKGRQCLETTALGSLATGINFHNSDTKGKERGQHCQCSHVQSDGIFHQTRIANPDSKGVARTSITMRCIKDLVREPHVAFQGMLDNGFVTMKNGKHVMKEGLTVLNECRIKGAASGKRQDVWGTDEAFTARICDLTPPINFKPDYTSLPDVENAGCIAKGKDGKQSIQWNWSNKYSKFLTLKKGQMDVFRQQCLPVFKDFETKELVACSKDCDFWDSERPSVGDLLAKSLDLTYDNVDDKAEDFIRDTFPSTITPPSRIGNSSPQDKKTSFDRQFKRHGVVDPSDPCHGVQGLQKATKTIGPNMSIADVCYHHDFVETCLRNGYCVVVIDGKKDQLDFQPLHLDEEGKLLLPSQAVDNARSPFSSTQQSHEIIDSSDPTHQLMVRDYKNFRAQVELHMEFSRKLHKIVKDIWVATKETSAQSLLNSLKELMHEFENLPPLTTSFSGGAVQVAGMVYKSLKYTRRNVPHIGTAEAQSPYTDVNRSLCENLIRKNPVAMYLNPVTFCQVADEKKSKEMKKKNVINFINYYRGDSLRAQERGFRSVVEQSVPHEKQEGDTHLSKANSQINQCSHNTDTPFLIKNKPAFSFETHVQIILDSLNGKVYKRLEVSTDDKRPLTVDVSSAKEHVFQRLNHQHKEQEKKSRKSSKDILCALHGQSDSNAVTTEDLRKLMSSTNSKLDPNELDELVKHVELDHTKKMAESKLISWLLLLCWEKIQKI